MRGRESGGREREGEWRKGEGECTLLAPSITRIHAI